MLGFRWQTTGTHDKAAADGQGHRCQDRGRLVQVFPNAPLALGRRLEVLLGKVQSVRLHVELLPVVLVEDRQGRTGAPDQESEVVEVELLDPHIEGLLQMPPPVDRDELQQAVVEVEGNYATLGIYCAPNPHRRLLPVGVLHAPPRSRHELSLLCVVGQHAYLALLGTDEQQVLLVALRRRGRGKRVRRRP